MKITELVCPNCRAPLSNDYVPNQQIECTSCGSTFIASSPETDETIICSTCQTPNPVEKRYCLSCGESLKKDCVLCHTSNLVGAVHCVTCGAHLTHARAKREKMQGEKLQLQQERSQRLKEKKARQKEEKLQMLLDDLDEPENHDFAIYQINQMGVEAIQALIETLLNDTDPDARYGSARALGQICSEHNVKGLIKSRAAKALIQALTDLEPAVRYWSVDALSKCRSKTAVEPLAALLEDPHEGVRKHTWLALQIIGGKRANEILAEADSSKGILGWIKGS